MQLQVKTIHLTLRRFLWQHTSLKVTSFSQNRYSASKDTYLKILTVKFKHFSTQWSGGVTAYYKSIWEGAASTRPTAAVTKFLSSNRRIVTLRMKAFKKKSHKQCIHASTYINAYMQEIIYVHICIHTHNIKKCYLSKSLHMKLDKVWWDQACHLEPNFPSTFSHYPSISTSHSIPPAYSHPFPFNSDSTTLPSPSGRSCEDITVSTYHFASGHFSPFISYTVAIRRLNPDALTHVESCLCRLMLLRSSNRFYKEPT